MADIFESGAPSFFRLEFEFPLVIWRLAHKISSRTLVGALLNFKDGLSVQVVKHVFPPRLAEGSMHQLPAAKGKADNSHFTPDLPAK